MVIQKRIGDIKARVSPMFHSSDASPMSETVLSPDIFHTIIHPITNNPDTNTILLLEEKVYVQEFVAKISKWTFHKHIIKNMYKSML